MKLWPFTELTPVKAAITARDTAVTKHDRLVTQLTQTQAELAKVKADAADAALRESAIEVFEISGEVGQCTAAVEALNSAVATANSEVAAAERLLASARDAELRAASVAELTGLIDQIEAVSLPFRDALSDLLVPLQRGGQLNHDVRAATGFFEILQADVGLMLGNATTALGIYAKQIEGGAAPAALPKPAPTPVATYAPPPTTTAVLPLYDIRWRDHTGTVRYVASGWDCSLPPTLAQRSITSGICVACDDPRAVKARRERGSVNCDPDRCVDLDCANPVPPPPPIERWMRPFAEPKWQLPAGSAPRPWISKGLP
jgi:hypothetical protein